MALSWLNRARASASVPALEAVLSSSWARRRLAKARSEPVEGQIIDEHLAAMLGLDDISGDSVLLGLDPDAARVRVARSIAIVDLPEPSPIDVRDLEWLGPSGGRAARLYTPPSTTTPSPLLIYVHGGGWVTGDLDTHDRLCRKLALYGDIRVLSIDYRLAPEHPFPAAAEDAIAAFRWTVEHADELGADRDRIGIGGDSAGGNLAAVVGLRCGRDHRPPSLTVMLYPGLDGTLAHASHETFADGWFLTRPMVDWYYEHYAGTSPELRKNPDLSPLHAPDVSAAAPALILPVHFDVLRDEAFRYAERLERAGVPVRFRCYETFCHGFVLLTRAPAAATAVEALGKEIGDVLRRGEL